MKALFYVILFVALGYAIYYLSMNYRKPGLASCPAGTQYVRETAGGAWLPTDPSDPWGSCVPDAEVASSSTP